MTHTHLGTSPLALSAGLLFTGLLSAGLASASPAADAAPQGFDLSPRWDLRLRHESVDDAGFPLDARADTLRLRLGVSGRWGTGWEALVEGEGTVAFDSRHDDGTAPVRVGRPTVLDPAGAELNQAWVGWSGEQSGGTLGRQRIQLDNQRWIGNSGWRQNEQTFDAVGLRWQGPAGTSARVYWLGRVHRVAGDDARDRLARERALDSWLLNVEHKQGIAKWVGYAYRHHDRDLATASTLTVGLRGSAQRVAEGRGWGWTAELARQQDAAGNPQRFSHAYWLLEPALTRHGITWRAGWEHLGGNGRHALQAPLGTLHAFNGWADRFNQTPAAGLEDAYASASGTRGRHAWTVARHTYATDTGGTRIGDEWNASWSFPVRGQVKGMLKLADFAGRGGLRDARKWWLQFEWASR